MAGEDWRGILNLMLNETSITSFVAKDTNNNPLIFYGTIPTEETGLPAISMQRSTKGGFSVENGFFIINCYGKNEADSSDLADLVNRFFVHSMGTADNNGFSFDANSRILRSISDNQCKNTPVELRVSNIINR